jgi:hypothetical protein
MQVKNLFRNLKKIFFTKTSLAIADRHHIDADPDLDPIFHFDAIQIWIRVLTQFLHMLKI